VNSKAEAKHAALQAALAGWTHKGSLRLHVTIPSQTASPRTGSTTEVGHLQWQYGKRGRVLDVKCNNHVVGDDVVLCMNKDNFSNLFADGDKAQHAGSRGDS
jgi:hypothetical protein